MIAWHHPWRSGRGLGFRACGRYGGGLDRGAGGPEALLGSLLGEPVARADVVPGGSGFTGGIDLGGLEFLRRFSQPPGGVEPGQRPVGGVESTERGQDPLDGIPGGHTDSVVDSRQESMIR